MAQKSTSTTLAAKIAEPFDSPLCIFTRWMSGAGSPTSGGRRKVNSWLPAPGEKPKGPNRETGADSSTLPPSEKHRCTGSFSQLARAIGDVLERHDAVSGTSPSKIIKLP